MSLLHQTSFATAAERRPRERLLLAMLDAAIASALPDRCLPAHLPAPPRGRTVVVGAGKAAAAMARAVEENWPGPLSGAVVTRYGHAVPCQTVAVLEAGHPVPDVAGLIAARRLLDLVSGLTAEDLVICLVSGGGSALLPLPPPGITLDDERAMSRALLLSGASIVEMNCVRRQLSLIRGGRLAAAAAPAQVVTLAISDVPGDDPATIASGPTVAGPSTRADALAVLRRRGIDLTAGVRAWLEQPDKGLDGERPMPLSDFRLIATPQAALEAAAAVARRAGYVPLILGDAIEGEARDVGLVHAGIAFQVLRHGQPLAGPCVLLSGGETSVTVRGSGRGGRNAEFLLGLLLGLPAGAPLSALAADTDGIDGTEDNAGALIDATSLDRAHAAGLSGRALLDANDAFGFFDALGDLVVTGPTLTNVNDFRAIAIDATSPSQERPAR